MSNVIDTKALISQLASRICSEPTDNIVLIGIHTGGVWIAEELHKTLGLSKPLGKLDISFYRDDFSRVGLNPEVRSSSLPVDIENQNIILIDDVLYTGRTIRAALNEIFSYGRPNRVRLGVLLNRAGRDLPIQADFVGQQLQLKDSQQAKLSNKNGVLSVNIIDTGGII